MSLLTTFVREDSLSSLTTLLRRAEPARPQLPAACFFHPFRIRKAFYFDMTFHVKHFSFLFLENHSKNRKSLPILQHFVEFQKNFSDFYEIALQNFTISCKIVKQCPLSSGHRYIFLETNRQKSTGEEAANA